MEDHQVPVARTWSPWKALVEEANVLVAQVLQSLAVTSNKPAVKIEQATPPAQVKDLDGGKSESIDLEIKIKSVVAAPKSATPKKRATEKLVVKSISKVTSKVAAKPATKSVAKKVTKKK